MFNALDEQQRQGAVWTASALVMSFLQELTTSTGEPILKTVMHPAGSIADQVDSQPTLSILGIPCIQMPGQQKAVPLVSEGQFNRLYLVNMKNSYGILDGGGVSVTTSGLSGTAFATDSTQFKFISRIDGRPIVDSNDDNADKSTYRYTGTITGPADLTP
jgi:HK97 family phage major capsid protein